MMIYATSRINDEAVKRMRVETVPSVLRILIALLCIFATATTLISPAIASSWIVGRTNAQQVNIRSSIGGKYIIRVPKGTPVLVTDSDDPDWYRVHVGSQHHDYGYIRKEYVRSIAEASQVESGALVAQIAKRFGEVSMHKQMLGMGTDPESLWCQWFVNYVIKMAGLSAHNAAWLQEKHVKVVYDILQSQGRLRSKPFIGAVYYTKSSEHDVAHCGIVVDVDDIENPATITVVDGCYLGRDTVTIRTINLPYENLLGFAVPWE